MKKSFVFAVLALALCAGAAFQGPGQAWSSTRLEMREVNGLSKFFDTQTGKEFVPRGMNYVRLATLRKHTDGTDFAYHSTFNRGAYDRVRAQKALQEMAADGYNTVRVFLNCATVGSLVDPGKPLNREYVANFVDFLRIARKNKLLVMPCVDWIPIPATTRKDRSMWCPDFQCTNVQVLSPEGLKANREFVIAFFRELKRSEAPLDALFGYDLRNELTSSRTCAAQPHLGQCDDGQRQDLFARECRGRQKMIEEGLVFWVNEMRKAIQQEVPGLPVGVGIVAPQEPHPIRAGDARFSLSRPLIEKSDLDFVDVHVYPEPNGLGMKEYAENFGISKATKKATIMGEFGGALIMYTNVDITAREMVALQKKIGEFGIEGWLFWSWDIDFARDTWAAADSGGVIRRALAPAGEGAAPEPIPARRANLPMKVKASASYQDMVPSLVSDGTMAQWNSGAFPPQWIEVSPVTPTEVTEIRLFVAQTPAGPTTHELWLKSPGGKYEKVRTFEGETKNYDRLVHVIEGSVIVESVKVVTVKSPSWVGWREIELTRIPR